MAEATTTATPENTAVRVALWHALHVLADAPLTCWKIRSASRSSRLTPTGAIDRT